MKVETHIIANTEGTYSRKATIAYPENVERLKLFVCLDAEFYVEKLDAIPIISGLIRTHQIPPVVCVFISNVDTERRQQDYICNEAYAEFIAGDVFGWMKSRFPLIEEKENLICGLSLSGLQAAYTQMKHRDRFHYALCQSGSFWWNDEFLSKLVDSHVGGSRYYLSVGNKETDKGIIHPPTGLRQDVSQIEATQRLAGILSKHDAIVKFDIFEGGHAFEQWKQELPAAISWLMGTLRP